MSNWSRLLRLSLVAACAALPLGCTARKYARFNCLVVAQKDPNVVFDTTEKVLGRYFTVTQARRRDQGLLSMEKSRVLEGDLAEDTYSIFATALVSKQAGQCVVRYKVQRTKLVGKWSCLGLGTSFYEKEAFAGPDDLLNEKIRHDLLEALNVAASSSAE